MKILCKKCGRKVTPIFTNHIYNGSESVSHGNEGIMNGSEHISTGHDKIVYNFTCPFCDTKHKQAKLINE